MKKRHCICNFIDVTIFICMLGCPTIDLLPSYSITVDLQNFASRTDTVFCGVFDGHGPYGHMVAKKVRDALPLKLSSHWEVSAKSDEVLREISLNTAGSIHSEDTAFLSADEESRPSVDLEDPEKLPEIFSTLKESFLKAFKVMDRELRVHTHIDCFCSGTTAVTLIKQVWILLTAKLALIYY